MKHEDSDIENLLRQVGGRDEPSEHMRNEVYAGTHAVWKSVVAERAQQQRRRTWSIAAGIAAAVAIGAVLTTSRIWTPAPAAPVSVGSIARVEGNLRVMSAAGEEPAARSIGQRIGTGETLMTDATTRTALSFGEGLSVRLDHNSRLKVISKDRLKLTAGALYVDAAPQSNHSLLVETSIASIRHVGTQYVVRARSDGIEVGVREGRVVISDDGVTHTGDAGEKLLLADTGQLTRSTLPPQHPDWQWTGEIAPAFNIEGQTLAAFLEWVARETGRKLLFASEQARSAAQQVTLRGSIKDLDINAALAAVLVTTNLRQYETSGDSLGIEFAATRPTAR